MKEVLPQNKCVVLKLYDYISIYDIRIKIYNKGNAIYAINYLIIRNPILKILWWFSHGQFNLRSKTANIKTILNSLFKLIMVAIIYSNIS